MNKILEILDAWIAKFVISSGILLFSPFKVSIIALLVMIGFDTICGSLYALKLKRFSSRGIKKSIIKLITYFASITTVRLVEIGISPIITTLALTHLMISFLVLTEAISVLKNLTLLGVPLPAQFAKILMKYVKNETLEELLAASSNRKEYLEEINDMINYQIPNIKSEKMRKLLEIKFEEWSNAISYLDTQLFETDGENKDLLYYRVSSLINSTNNIINDRWKEEGISDPCVKAYNEWRSTGTQRWMEGVKEICYSNDSMEKKKKYIIERKIATLYEALLDIQKGETNLLKKSCDINIDDK